MTNPSILLQDGSEIPEGIMDAFITTAAALHDLKKKRNSRTPCAEFSSKLFSKGMICLDQVF